MGAKLVALRRVVLGVLAWLRTFLGGLFKWVLRFLTGKHELERICLKLDPDTEPGSLCVQLEDCLLRSKDMGPHFRGMMGPDCDAGALIERVLHCKRITSSNREVVTRRLMFALTRIKALRRLKQTLEIKLERYDSDNEQHEQLLWTLWDVMRPGDERPPRKGKEWTELGFQGHDPATDFRGMGLLGLQNLVDAFKIHPVELHGVFVESLEQKNWFSVAITGIHVTSDIYTLLKAQRRTDQLSVARHFFYTYGCSMERFVDLYAKSFVMLNERWKRTNPPNVMSWQPIHDAHVKGVTAWLEGRMYMPSKGAAARKRGKRKAD